MNLQDVFHESHHQTVGQFALQIQITVKKIQCVIIGSYDLVFKDTYTPHTPHISTRIGVMVKRRFNRYIGHFPDDGLCCSQSSLNKLPPSLTGAALATVPK